MPREMETLAPTTPSPGGVLPAAALSGYSDWWVQGRMPSAEESAAEIELASTGEWDWSIADACECPDELRTQFESIRYSEGVSQLTEAETAQFIATYKTSLAVLEAAADNVLATQRRSNAALPAASAVARTIMDTLDALQARSEQLWDIRSQMAHDFYTATLMLQTYGIPLPPSASRCLRVPPATALTQAAKCTASMPKLPQMHPTAIEEPMTKPSVQTPNATQNAAMDELVYALRVVRPWCEAGVTHLSARRELVALQAKLQQLELHWMPRHMLQQRCSMHMYLDDMVAPLLELLREATGTERAKHTRQQHQGLTDAAISLCEAELIFVRDEIQHHDMHSALHGVMEQQRGGLPTLVWVSVGEVQKHVQGTNAPQASGAHVPTEVGQQPAQHSVPPEMPVFVMDHTGRVHVAGGSGAGEAH